MEKIRKDRQHSSVLLWLSLYKPFQGMRVFNCNWIWKMKYFRIFFFVSLYVALWIIETLLISISFSYFSFSAVRADHLPQSVLQIRPWNQTTTTVHKIRPRSDHHNRQSDESQIRPQIRPCTNSRIRLSSDQTTRSDQPTDYYPWLLHFKSVQHTQPREMVQVRCIVCGLGQGGYIELWMNLAKHTFHTRSAWSFRTSSPA